MSWCLLTCMFVSPSAHGRVAEYCDEHACLSVCELKGLLMGYSCNELLPCLRCDTSEVRAHVKERVCL